MNLNIVFSIYLKIYSNNFLLKKDKDNTLILLKFILYLGIILFSLR